MENRSEVSRSELWEKIYSIVSCIPRAKVDGDAVDAASASTAVEKMLMAEYLPKAGHASPIKE